MNGSYSAFSFPRDTLTVPVSVTSQSADGHILSVEGFSDFRLSVAYLQNCVQTFLQELGLAGLGIVRSTL
jgi:hypothetical protein